MTGDELDRCELLDDIHNSIDIRRDERFPQVQTRPFSTGPHVPMRGNSAAGLAEFYAKSVEASEVLGLATWRNVLAADFFAVVAMVPSDAKGMTEALTNLAASCVAALEEVHHRANDSTTTERTERP